MPYVPQQAPAGLDSDGVRKHGEEQFREIARAWTSVDKSLADNAAALAGKVAKTGDVLSGGLKFNYGGIHLRHTPAGSYSMLQYADPNDFYMLLTNAGDPDGSFNGLRPFRLNLATGNISMSHHIDLNDVNINTLNMNGNITTAPSGNITQPGPAPSIQVYGNINYTCLSFHCPGAFGSNFGMANDGNFYFGGWSHGAVLYKLWSGRDFTALPCNNVRLAYLGDYTHASDTGLAEPYGAGVHTGMSGFGWTATLAIITRYRQLQIFTSSWFAVAYV